jgi:glyoxylase-like metal-dependent hydrolase (beta-lactamase superfamily II)
VGVPGPRIVVGDVEVVCLSDATVDYPWPLAELFPGVPDEAWEPFRLRYPTAFGAPTVWRSWYRCFLIRSARDTLLFDTGMGPAGSPMAGVFGMAGRLQDELEAAGVRPDDIDAVVLSHLHPDHVGGNLRRDGDDLQLAFPRARYLVNEADWTAFHDVEVQRHFPFEFVDQTITPLETLKALDLFEGDHAATEEVTLLPAPGHTPGHMTARIRSRGAQTVLVADALLHPAQVTEPDWSSMFDMDADLDRRTRHELLDELESENVLFAASHFPEPGFGRIVRDDGRRWWQPLEADAESS